MSFQDTYTVFRMTQVEERTDGAHNETVSILEKYHKRQDSALKCWFGVLTF